MLPTLVVLALALAAVGSLIRLQRRGPFIEYVVLLRYQILVALLLVGLPLLAVLVYSSLLEGLFVLQGWEAFIVAALSLLVCWSAMLSSRIVIMYSDKRLGIESAWLPRWAVKYQIPLWACLSLPLIGTVLALSPEKPWCALAIALGGLSAFLCLALATWLRERFLSQADLAPDLLLNSNRPVFQTARGRPSPPRLAGLSHVLDRFFGQLGPGYVDDDGKTLAGHILAGIFFLLIFALYGAGYLILRPGRQSVPLAPALAYVEVLLIVLCWALSGMAFLLDRYRVPLGVLLLALSFVVSFAFDSDHYYVRLSGGPPPEQDVQKTARLRTALEAWMAGTPRPMVVVAANGGGIQASAWTARVLTGLEAECRGFGRSIAMISAVSGGSVGAMYFVDRYAETGFDASASTIRSIRKAAESSSLDEVGWGVAYPDLWRIFGPFLVQPKTLDRGWALEEAWHRHLRPRESSLKLSEWRAGIEQGWRPLTVFNSTIVENGQRFLLAPLSLPSDLGTDFYSQYPGEDISLVSAVRLSATFPYVTPVSRGLSQKESAPSNDLHIADGGYYDNFGVVTALAWVDSVISAYARLGGRRILLLEIRSSPVAQPTAPYSAPDGRRGWALDTIGPIQTLLSVRTGAQLFRNERDVRMATERYRLTRELGSIEVLAQPLTVPKAGPLSWKLTKDQIADIDGAWRDPETQRGVERIRAFLGAACQP